MKILLYVFMALGLNSRCQDGNSFYRQNENSTVTKREIGDIPKKFFPDCILQKDSLIFFSGSTDMSHNNKEIMYSYNLNSGALREIHAFNSSVIVDLTISEKDVFVAGRYFEESGLKQEELNFLGSISKNSFKSTYVSENIIYAIYSEANYLIKVSDYKNKMQIFLSKDEGHTWDMLQEFNSYLNLDYNNTIICNDELITYGTQKGFKPSDYSVICLNLKTGVERKISIKDFKGEFRGISKMNNIPYLRTSEGDSNYLYDLTEEKPEIKYHILSPSSEWKIVDLLVFEDTEFAITVNNNSIDDRYRIYSNKKDAGWKIDFSTFSFDVYTVEENRVVGFDVNRNLVIIIF